MNFIDDLKSNTFENLSIVRLAVKNLSEGEFLVYRLCSGENRQGRICYLIAVAKVGSDGTVTEAVAFSDFCCGIADAIRIFNAVSRGKTTPCTLYDVIYDMISE